ncbi:MAG TPA: hypothetical protein DCZ03_01230 [Gammaproteobacteria bacterium]|nr:hypothetical protein [Gammaproteobacteria bacterium]
MGNPISKFFYYGRFFLAPAIVLVGSLLLILGGHWLSSFLLAMVILLTAGDLLLGEDLQEWTFEKPEYFRWVEYGAQFLSFFAIFLFLWMLAAPAHDLFQFANWVERLFGIEMWQRHQADGLWHDMAALALAGFAGGVCAVQVGHELMHQTANSFARALAFMGQSLCLISRIYIHHPFGHHAYAGTMQDPATPQRGENFYVFVLRSIFGQYQQIWALERARLHTQGISMWSLHNQALRGWVCELLVLFMVTYLAGIPGCVGFLLLGVMINVTLEFANYIQHYGLIRIEGEPFLSRHAWNDNHKMSLWFGCGIPRHAAHHMDASVRFWQLEPMPEEAPRLAYGYLISILMALIPVWWHQVYNSKLLTWDEQMASERERIQGQRANALSGQGKLVQAAIDSAQIADFTPRSHH